VPTAWITEYATIAEMMPIASSEPVIGMEITTDRLFVQVPSVRMLVLATVSAALTQTVTMTVVALLALPMLDASALTDLPEQEATPFVLMEFVSTRISVFSTTTITMTVWPKLVKPTVKPIVLAAPALPTEIVVF